VPYPRRDERLTDPRGQGSTEDSNVHRNFRRAAAVIAAAALVPALGAFRFTGFDHAPSRAAAANATSWLRTQQQADGSFEVAGFPGFETPDAIIAIAENAQQQAKWSRAQARAAVEATRRNGTSPLHAIDDLADAGPNAGQAAKLVILVTRPLGLNPKKFDPDGDGRTNLRAVVDAGLQADGSYGAFNATLYAAIAKRFLGGVPASTIANIRNAQEPNGGWNFTGDRTCNCADADTTALAIEALVSARVRKDDVDLRQGLAFLARSHRPTGAWQSFGADDPNSTAVATMAITSAGFDPTVVCWRDVVAPERRGQQYTSPVGWLRQQQQGNGRIASPNDSFGVNTFPTSQTIQAIRRGWMPTKALGKQRCT
jgi:hypothetical protein